MNDTNQNRKAPDAFPARDVRALTPGEAGHASGPPTRVADGILNIAVDFDGVLFDHTPYLLRGFRDAHGIDLEEEGMRYWDFFQYRAVRERGLTWNCVRTVLHKIETDPVLHTAPPRDAHARDAMGAWIRAGHRVSVVTAREPASREVTELFLRTHGIPHHALVMGASKKTGYDVLVDDAPHNVLMAAADGGLALLMDHPYNRDVPTRRNPLRVRDWREVAREVDRHTTERANDAGADGAAERDATDAAKVTVEASV